MKYVSMRIPEAGPLGETFFEASVRAIVAALLVNSPAGGCVESVVTLATQRLFVFFLAGMKSLMAGTCWADGCQKEPKPPEMAALGVIN